MSTSFSSNHNFSKGFFYVADGTFNFYDTEKNTAYQDCYASFNAGKTLGIGNYDSANIIHSNGKFSLLVGTSTSNRDHFYIVDAKKMCIRDSCEILKFNLENEGYEVDTANSAAEALKMDISSYHLIILDLSLIHIYGRL